MKTHLIVVAVVCTIGSPAYSQQGRPKNIDEAVLQPPPNKAGWNNTAVTVVFQCGVSASHDCPLPMIVSSEGAGQRPTRIVSSSSARPVAVGVGVSINIDRTAPRVAITSTSLLPSGAIRVSAAVSDDLSGIRVTACNGRPASFVAGAVTCDIPAHDGVNDIAVTAVDAADNSASAATQQMKPATSADSEIAPKDMVLKVGTARTVQFLDSAGQEIDGAGWRVENPSVAMIDPGTGTISGLMPGETFLIATTVGRTARAKVTVFASTAALPPGTTLWRMSSPKGIFNTLTATPTRLPGGPEIVFVGTQPDGFVVLRATTMAGRLVSKEYAALSPGEHVVDWMGDHDGGVLLWAKSGQRSTIVRTGSPAEGGLWRYESASPATAYWAMSAWGTLFVAEKPQTGFGYVTGLDSRSGTVQFRVPVPHVPGTHGGFGALTIPDGDEAVMMFAASPKRVDLLHLRDDGSARTSTVVEFGDSDATLSHLAGVYPDGHGAVVALMRRRHADGRSDGLVVRMNGDERSSYALPAVGEYVLGENDEALTTDNRTLVSFNVVTGKIRWTFETAPGESVRLEFAAAGGGAVVSITGGREPGRYRFDASGNRLPQ